MLGDHDIELGSSKQFETFFAVRRDLYVAPGFFEDAATHQKPVPIGYD
jgi:hypothetical protein